MKPKQEQKYNLFTGDSDPHSPIRSAGSAVHDNLLLRSTYDTPIYSKVHHIVWALIVGGQHSSKKKRKEIPIQLISVNRIKMLS